MAKLYYHEGQWQLPGQQDKKAQRVDVPNEPKSLMGWLNARRVRAEEPDPIDTPDRETWAEAQGEVAPTPPERDPQEAQLMNRSRTAQEIVEFILDEAAVHQVENIMQALGTRVAELAKQVRA